LRPQPVDVAEYLTLCPIHYLRLNFGESWKQDLGERTMAGNASQSAIPQWSPQLGERVQVVFPGSKRDGKLATIKAVKVQDGLPMAALQVDGESKLWTEVLLGWLESV